MVPPTHNVYSIIADELIWRLISLLPGDVELDSCRIGLKPSGNQACNIRLIADTGKRHLSYISSQRDRYNIGDVMANVKIASESITFTLHSVIMGGLATDYPKPKVTVYSPSPCRISIGDPRCFEKFIHAINKHILKQMVFKIHGTKILKIAYE